jgi:hypothetical protein
MSRNAEKSSRLVKNDLTKRNNLSLGKDALGRESPLSGRAVRVSRPSASQIAYF